MEECMAQPLRIERDDTGPAGAVVTIYLDDAATPVTVLNRDMIARLDASLDVIGKEISGLVLATSDSRVFVAGADLGEINDLSDGDLDDYLAEGQRVFGRIAALPCCTVAAINGAALGGGLELALHCDVLLGLEPHNPDKPYPIGLPEASLGLCPGWGGTNTLPARIDSAKAIKATATGTTFSVTEALELGLVERLYATREELLSAARERARNANPDGGAEPGSPRNITDSAVASRVTAALAHVESELPDTDAAIAVVSCIRAGLSGGWRAALESERRELIKLRKTPTARERISAFFARTSKT